MNDETKKTKEEAEEVKAEASKEKPKRVFISTSLKQQSVTKRARIQTRDLSTETIEKNLRGKGEKNGK